MAEIGNQGAGQRPAGSAISQTGSASSQATPATNQNDILQPGSGATSGTPSNNTQQPAAGNLSTGAIGAAGTPQPPQPQGGNTTATAVGLPQPTQNNRSRGGQRPYRPRGGYSGRGRGAAPAGTGNVNNAPRSAMLPPPPPVGRPQTGRQGAGGNLDPKANNFVPGGLPAHTPTGPRSAPPGGIHKPYRQSAPRFNQTAQTRDRAPDFVPANTPVNKWQQSAGQPGTLGGNRTADEARAADVADDKAQEKAKSEAEKAAVLEYEAPRVMQVWHLKSTAERMGVIARHLQDSREILQEQGQQNDTVVDVITCVPKFAALPAQENASVLVQETASVSTEEPASVPAPTLPKAIQFGTMPPVQLGSMPIQAGPEDAGVSEGTGNVKPKDAAISVHIPELFLWFCDPVRAAQNMKLQEPESRIVVVNDATTKNEPCGGGFEAGLTDDYEERLLSKTTLYPKLKALKSSFPLMWNTKEHQLIHSPNVLVWKKHPEHDLPDAHKFDIDVLTCPADDLTKQEVPLSTPTGGRTTTVEVVHFGKGGFANTPDKRYRLTQAGAKARMDEKLREILRYANDCKFDTVILPPYGHGKGHPMEDVASIMRNIIQPAKTDAEQFTSIKRVVIAVTKRMNDECCWINFRDVLSVPFVTETGQQVRATIDFKFSKGLYFRSAAFEQADKADRESMEEE